MQIEPMTDSHASAVLAIYQAGIDEGNASSWRWWSPRE
jgi:L-amino acid N-acyltransferase YncA